MYTKYLHVVLIVVFSFTGLLSAQNKQELLHFDSKELDSTFLSYKNQLKIAQGQNDDFKIATSYWRLGEFYFRVGVYSEATDQFNKALLILQKKPNDTLQVHINNAQGSMHLALKNYDKAEASFSKSLKLSKVIDFKKGLARSTGLLGSCYEKRKEYKKALAFEKQSLTEFKLLQDTIGLATANENIGSIYEDLENFDLASQFFNKAYGYTEGSKNSLEANILNNIGDVFRKRGSYEQAVVYTTKAMHLAKEINDKNRLSSAYRDLSKTYALLGKYKDALEYLEMAEQITSNIFNGQNSNQINVLQTVYETNQKETRIMLLEEENNVAKANRNFWIVAVILISIIIFVLHLFRAKKRKEAFRIQQFQKQLLQAQLEKKAILQENLRNEVQLKASALSKYSLHLSHKNKLLSDLASTLLKLADRKNMDKSAKIKQLANDINENVKQDNEARQFQNYFSEIHPEFGKKLIDVCKEKLSQTEMRLAMLLRLNLSSKEIASILRVTPDSVRVARYRLRKKLRIDPKTNLIHFLLQL